MSSLFSPPPPPPPVVLPPPPPPPQAPPPMPDIASPVRRESALESASKMGGSREETNLTGENKRKKLGGGSTIASGAQAPVGSDSYGGAKLSGG